MALVIAAAKPIPEMTRPDAVVLAVMMDGHGGKPHPVTVVPQFGVASAGDKEVALGLAVPWALRLIKAALDFLVSHGLSLVEASRCSLGPVARRQCAPVALP